MIALGSAVAATAQLLRFAHSGHLDNGLSLFTIQSNALAIVALLVSPRAPWFRGAATTYISITGIIYALFLSGGNPLFVSPDNAMLHYVMPIALWVDWIKTKGELTQPTTALIGSWLVYPLLYLAYTYTRGARVHWYPYGFIDPRIGPLELTCVLGGIFGLAIVIALIVISRGRAPVLA